MVKIGEPVSDQDWDRALTSLEDHSIFQSSGWARHKAASGWRARRVLRPGSDGSPAAAAQALVKDVPGGVVVWGRGAPMGQASAWDAAMRAALIAGLRGPVRYLRVCSYRAVDVATLAALGAQGWKRPKKPLSANTTFRLDLSRSDDLLEGALSSNWSHNLRRGLKRSAVRRWENPDPDEMIAVYRAMESYKGVKASYDAASLRSLIAGLGPALRVWRADDETGKPIALRAGGLFADAGWDLLAASSDAGRKVYASYALLWNLVLDCKRAGARRYDLGGADEKTGKGVYDFKKGTGAAFVEYVGEWDWAAPAFARAPAGWAIARKLA